MRYRVRDGLKKTDAFLHDKGYTYFTIGALTYIEVNDLIDVWNDQQREAKREASKRH